MIEVLIRRGKLAGGWIHMERRTPSEETHTQREDSHGYQDRDEATLLKQEMSRTW